MSPGYQKHLGTISKLLASEKMKNKPSLRYWALLHETDQDRLVETAKKDPDYRIRKEAVTKITDQEELFSIAQTDQDYRVCKAAITKITDKKMLLMLRLSVSSDLQPAISYRSQELDNL